MSKYVALFIGNDGQLGRTIQCDTWGQALEMCEDLANENQYVINQFDMIHLSICGSLRLTGDAFVHIGLLEEQNKKTTNNG